MYPEFIAIYVMLVIVIALLGAVLFLLFKLMKNGISNSGTHYVPTQQTNDQYYAQQQYPQYQEPQYQQQGGSVVFCKQCATQFDSSLGYCPQCGTRR